MGGTLPLIGTQGGIGGIRALGSMVSEFAGAEGLAAKMIGIGVEYGTMGAVGAGTSATTTAAANYRNGDPWDKNIITNSVVGGITALIATPLSETGGIFGYVSSAVTVFTGDLTQSSLNENKLPWNMDKGPFFLSLGHAATTAIVRAGIMAQTGSKTIPWWQNSFATTLIGVPTTIGNDYLWEPKKKK